jgi:hypothetical protein
MTAQNEFKTTFSFVNNEKGKIKNYNYVPNILIG